MHSRSSMYICNSTAIRRYQSSSDKDESSVTMISDDDYTVIVVSDDSSDDEPSLIRLLERPGKHDHHAVDNFTTTALTHLRQQHGLTVSHVIQWTDGCAAQYKSRGPFADITHSMEDLDATLERNFYGSRHGKGASDGEDCCHY